MINTFGEFFLESTHLDVLINIFADTSQKPNEIFQLDAPPISSTEVVNLLKNVLQYFSFTRVVSSDSLIVLRLNCCDPGEWKYQLNAFLLVTLVSALTPLLLCFSLYFANKQTAHWFYLRAPSSLQNPF